MKVTSSRIAFEIATLFSQLEISNMYDQFDYEKSLSDLSFVYQKRAIDATALFVRTVQ